jgi:hypothetical protein
VTRCIYVDGHQHLGRTCCLHLQGKIPTSEPYQVFRLTHTVVKGY